MMNTSAAGSSVGSRQTLRETSLQLLHDTMNDYEADGQQHHHVNSNANDGNDYKDSRHSQQDRRQQQHHPRSQKYGYLHQYQQRQQQQQQMHYEQQQELDYSLVDKQQQNWRHEGTAATARTTSTTIRSHQARASPGRVGQDHTGYNNNTDRNVNRTDDFDDMFDTAFDDIPTTTLMTTTTVPNEHLDGTFHHQEQHGHDLDYSQSDPVYQANLPHIQQEFQQESYDLVGTLQHQLQQSQRKYAEQADAFQQQMLEERQRQQQMMDDLRTQHELSIQKYQVQIRSLLKSQKGHVERGLLRQRKQHTEQLERYQQAVLSLLTMDVNDKQANDNTNDKNDETDQEWLRPIRQEVKQLRSWHDQEMRAVRAATESSKKDCQKLRTSLDTVSSDLTDSQHENKMLQEEVERLQALVENVKRDNQEAVVASLESQQQKQPQTTDATGTTSAAAASSMERHELELLQIENGLLQQQVQEYDHVMKEMRKQRQGTPLRDRSNRKQIGGGNAHNDDDNNNNGTITKPSSTESHATTGTGPLTPSASTSSSSMSSGSAERKQEELLRGLQELERSIERVKDGEHLDQEGSQSALGTTNDDTSINNDTAKEEMQLEAINPEGQNQLTELPEHELQHQPAHQDDEMNLQYQQQAAVAMLYQRVNQLESERSTVIHECMDMMEASRKATDVELKVKHHELEEAAKQKLAEQMQDGFHKGLAQLVGHYKDLFDKQRAFSHWKLIAAGSRQFP